MTRRFADFSRPAIKPYTWVDYFLIFVVSVVCSAAFIAFMFVCLLIRPAGAHDTGKGWAYPWECCSDKDCEEISATRARPVQGGYLIDGKHHVPQDQVRHSPDGRYHACFPQPDVLKCFWAPPSGS